MKGEPHRYLPYFRGSANGFLQTSPSAIAA
jgi:hypothetical protein